MRCKRFWLVGLCVLACSALRAGDVGFPEDFALAEDRPAALKRLIPGTKEYYYYHCLHFQNEGKLDQVDTILKQWIKRYNRTGRVVEIENRQALLRYETNPQGTLEYIRRQLGIQFNHQREIVGQKPKLPTTLNQNLISRQTLTKRALDRHSRTLQGLENRALQWAIELQLSPDRRRHLLNRLTRPDYPNLVRLIVDDLKYKDSRDFGSLKIHGLLLLEQLRECLELKPDLRNKSKFVNTYLRKLRPSPDVDWRNDAAAREAYLNRLWDFVVTLDPVHNSLKAHVLYHRLAHDRATGLFHKGRFMDYLKLPRSVSYANRDYIDRAENRRHRADLRADFSSVTLLGRVGDDEPLVRSFLAHFFLTETTTTVYEPYVNDVYLKHRFAETKIVNGLGDMEQWYSMLPPAQYQALKERVDLDFAVTNKTVFDADGQVALDIHVKNVKTLIVKVFEINTLNYFRTNLRKIDTAIDLDGLVANDEKTYTYSEPALRRVKRHFEFPGLTGRGVYVIDFIGSGKSSRALVQKGKLRYLARTSVAGHVFTVLDETNRKLPEAALYLAGHRYEANEDDGTITVPFTGKPGRQPVVLVNGAFASLDTFEHQAEGYRLTAGMYVDREALLTRTKAQVVIRPSLTLNGTPVTLKVLEETELVITSTDREGVSTTKEVGDFKLTVDGESSYEFQVPANLARISFTVKAKVQNLSQAKKLDLAVSESFTLNGIDGTEKLEDLHLSYAGGVYALDLLGKTGEVKTDRPVQLVLKHRDFRDTVNVTLKSGEDGRVALGALQDIDWINVKGPEGTEHRWHLLEDRHTYQRSLHGRAGEAVFVPYMGTAAAPSRSELSLLELRGGTFARDRFKALAIADGYLVISDLPAGDYDLYLKRENQRIHVRLTAGEKRLGYVLSPYRQLQVRNRLPLQIAGVDVAKDELTLKLRNASKYARVHVVATRYMPEFPLYENLDTVAVPEPYVITLPAVQTLYVVGRTIGEEYTYILERKQATTYPGNLLKRPSLLLNPWAIRTTETERQDAKRGDRFQRKSDSRDDARRGSSAKKREQARAAGGFANLDFLGEPAAVLLNLKPDEKGVITIKRADLGAHHHLHIVAVDPRNTAYRHVSLPEAAMKFNDLRLADGLDPKGHFTEQKEVSVVGKGTAFVLADITTSDFQTYDSLDKVYALYATLSGNATLAEFGFILNWPKLKPEEKREKYTEYACHELNVFLAEKDPAFFNETIKPYLKNKYHKTFMDNFLVGDPLDGFLKPWAYRRLNIVERILLARRIKAEHPHAARHVKDLFDLLPPTIEHFNHLFKTAIKGRALETADDYGIAGARDRARKGQGLRENLKRRTAGRRSNRAILAGAMKELDAAAATAPAPAAPPADALAELAPEEESQAAGEEFESLALVDLRRRKSVRQLYRALDKTKEWVENNYYHLPIEQQNAGLVTVNGFWRDYAQYDGTGPFLSENLAEASRNFAEMMLALAVLDLPFEAAKHESAIEKTRFSLKAGSPLVVYHKEIKKAPQAEEKTAVLVSQNFYRHGERYLQVGNERFDRYITQEFLVHVPYGCHVVITNPTSSRQKLDVLLQVPHGAMPIMKGQYTRSLHVVLEPYRTWTTDYFFYFPAAGSYGHYPVHVAKNERLIASAPPVTLKVVEEPTTVDRTSWDYISQNGTPEQVIGFLGENNLGRTKLDRIAWRMHEKAFFRKVAALLAERHVYNHTLWSYGLKHNVLPPLREYLKHADKFLNRCGSAIDCTLVTIDPVERKTYQHMEYWPLVNARAHQLGTTRKILNNRFHGQYMRLMTILSYRSKLDDDDLMSVTYYMLLQDRVEEALKFFSRVKARNLAARLQYDYLEAYLGFFTEKLRRSRSIAAEYADHPVDRWRNLFLNVTAQLDEIEGKGAAVVDKEDRTQVQTRLAATETSFEFAVESRKVTITYQNLKECRVNYYRMDIELLFSRNPFVGKYAAQFASIRPNATAVVKLKPRGTTHSFALPREFHSSNVLIEILAGGVKKTQTYFANTVTVQVIENYAQLKVAHEDTKKPLPKVYVKVYAQMQDGRVRFYKDGYTDLRGRFDYGSLSTNDLDFVKRFSILVLSDEHGAVVREASPPKR